MQNEDQYIRAYRLINKYNAKTKQPKTFGTPHTVCGSEAQLMDMLGAHHDMTVTSLANHLGISKGAVSQTLSKLQSKGLIEKNISPNGSNEVLICLSKDGYEVLKNYRAYLDCRLRKVIGILEGMSVSEKKNVLALVDALEVAFDQY